MEQVAFLHDLFPSHLLGARCVGTFLCSLLSTFSNPVVSFLPWGRPYPIAYAHPLHHLLTFSQWTLLNTLEACSGGLKDCTGEVLRLRGQRGTAGFMSQPRHTISELLRWNPGREDSEYHQI